MCLLTYIPEDIQPDIDALLRGAKMNGDGHGFAIVIPEFGTEGRILVRKAMNVEGLLKEFAALRRIYPNGPALFHSRITTDGITDLYNCHPFMVDGDKRTVVGHNGILPSSVRPGSKDDRSDTRIFAEEVAGMFRLNTLMGRQLAGEWMGDYNKMVVLTVDPAFDQYGYIINESRGTWHEGIWYSNSTFKGYRTAATYSTGYYTSGTGWGEDWEYCLVKDCSAKYATVSPHTLRCSVCKNCSICQANPCECVLTEIGEGKENGTNRTIVSGSPKAGATVQGADNATTVAEYVGALEAAQALWSGARNLDYDYDADGDPADQGGRSQLEQVLALVDHLNHGGNIEDLPLEQQAALVAHAHEMVARRERDELLDAVIAEYEASQAGAWPPDSPAEGSESDAEPRSDLVPAWVSEQLTKRGDASDDQDALMLIATAHAVGLELGN